MQPNGDGATSLAEECCLALDHLRNALDLAPERSPAHYLLVDLVRRVAAVVDVSNPARR